MSSHVEKYIKAAQKQAHGNGYTNFNGNGNRSNNNYSNFTGGQFSYQTGSPAAMPAPQSTPYAIQISNTSGATYASFPIFNAWTYLNPPAGATWTTGNLSLVSGNATVVISSAIPNVTYQYFLNQTSQNPFSIGQTQLITTTNASQVNQAMQITTTDSNGNTVGKVINWLTSPNQFQNGNIINNTQYRIDGSTQMSMNILPNAVFVLWFFPMQNVDTSRSLVGADPSQQFGNPGLQTANTIVIPAGPGATIVQRS